MFVSIFIISCGLYEGFQWFYDSSGKASYTIRMMYETPQFYFIVLLFWGLCTIYEIILIIIGKDIKPDQGEQLRYLLHQDFNQYLHVINEMVNEKPERLYGTITHEKESLMKSENKHQLYDISKFERSTKFSTLADVQSLKLCNNHFIKIIIQIFSWKNSGNRNS